MIHPPVQNRIKQAAGCCQETGLALCRLHTRAVTAEARHPASHVTGDLDRSEVTASVMKSIPQSTRGTSSSVHTEGNLGANREVKRRDTQKHTVI